nr:hypothetical protein [Tanacetum cinerariifolium]
ESSSAAAARPAGGFRENYGFVATREVGYGITDSWHEIVETLQGAPVSTDTELGGYVREFETRVRQDTDEIYMRLDDEQTERQLLASRLNMLFRDRRAHAYTCQLMEIESRMSREAWVRATDASDLVHGEVMSLRTTVLGQMSEIRELQAADCRRQNKPMAPRRTTRSTADQETVNATTITNAQLQAMIDQGVTIALAARDALRSTNGDDSHNFGTGVRRTERSARECTYTDFLKYDDGQILSLKRDQETRNGTLGAKGLPDMIHGSVVASKPKTMQESIEIATELMDKKIRTFAEHETVSKRKFENTSRTTRNQQQQHSNKRQNTGRVYTAAPGEKKQYGGSRPLSAKCNYHHDGPCAPECRNCNKIGHSASNCRSVVNTNNANNQRGTELGQKPTCYECGVRGYFRRECPKLKNNNNHGNQGRRNNAPARVYAVGCAGTDPDANVVTGKYQAVIVCAEKIVRIPWGYETLIIH